MSTTRVYLVGAGPGDPGLLTLRAAELLAQADVVVYDYLASDAVMRFASADAERCFVGKKGFSQHVTQSEINDLLVDLAQAGRGTVVRLKGGDPFVFGRGGEEALALAKRGIPFEVVPGITAGVAAPAYAGIPVTHRHVASSVTLVTGHETPEKSESSIDWTGLAKAPGTLCFYMGIRDLPLITKRLIDAGRPATEPVALVRCGTTAAQDTLVATLDTVVRVAQEARFQAPAIIVVGDVVSLRDELNWYETRPLFGKTVVVTRSRAQASALSGRLQAAGAEIIEFPTIEIVARPRTAEATACIARLASDAASLRETYDWVVFTSANGVTCFFDLLRQTNNDARIFGDVKIAAIGPATARELACHGITADLVPPRFVAESVADALCRQGVGAATRVLIPRAAAARDTLPNLLREARADVDILPLYDTVAPDEPEQVQALVERLRAGKIDAVTFTSSTTARHFAALLDQAAPGERADLMKNVICASIGPVTSKTMRDLHLPVSVEASEYTIPVLAQTLQETLGRR